MYVFVFTCVYMRVLLNCSAVIQTMQGTIKILLYFHILSFVIAISSFPKIIASIHYTNWKKIYIQIHLRYFCSVSLNSIWSRWRCVKYSACFAFIRSNIVSSRGPSIDQINAHVSTIPDWRVFANQCYLTLTEQ